MGRKVIITVTSIVLADYLLAKINPPRIIIKKNVKFGYNAMTLPPFGIYISKKEANNAKLIKHELVHWKQYQKTGLIIFTLKYIAQKLAYGYDKMPMEIEAREDSGENEFCKKNYTFCVKNGLANTVNNPNFRSQIATNKTCLINT